MGVYFRGSPFSQTPFVHSDSSCHVRARKYRAPPMKAWRRNERKASRSLAHRGVDDNRGPQHRTPNSRIPLIVMTANKVSLFGLLSKFACLLRYCNLQ